MCVRKKTKILIIKILLLFSCWDAWVFAIRPGFFDIESDHLNSEHFDIDFGHPDPHQGYLHKDFGINFLH